MLSSRSSDGRYCPFVLANNRGSMAMAAVLVSGALTLPYFVTVIRLRVLNAVAHTLAVKGQARDLRNFFAQSFLCSDPSVAQSCLTDRKSNTRSVGRFKYVLSCQRKETGFAIKILAGPTSGNAPMTELFPERPFVCSSNLVKSL